MQYNQWFEYKILTERGLEYDEWLRLARNYYVVNSKTVVSATNGNNCKNHGIVQEDLSIYSNHGR